MPKSAMNTFGLRFAKTLIVPARHGLANPPHLTQDKAPTESAPRKPAQSLATAA